LLRKSVSTALPTFQHILKTKRKSRLLNTDIISKIKFNNITIFIISIYIVFDLKYQNLS